MKPFGPLVNFKDSFKAIIKPLIEVIFNKDKKYFLKINDNIQEVSKENISSEFSKLPKEVLKNITLTADEHLEYKDIVDTMSILKNMNIENISLNIQNKN